MTPRARQDRQLVPRTAGTQGIRRVYTGYTGCIHSRVPKKRALFSDSQKRPLISLAFFLRNRSETSLLTPLRDVSPEHRSETSLMPMLRDVSFADAQRRLFCRSQPYSAVFKPYSAYLSRIEPYLSVLPY